jgi:hypothetical protein
MVRNFLDREGIVNRSAAARWAIRSPDIWQREEIRYATRVWNNRFGRLKTGQSVVYPRSGKAATRRKPLSWIKSPMGSATPI